MITDPRTIDKSYAKISVYVSPKPKSCQSTIVRLMF